MNNLVTRRFEMFKRVRDFGTVRAADFPARSLGRDLFNTLTTVIGELETCAACQSSGINTAMEGTASKAAVRTALFELLATINRTARVMAFDTPGLENKFRMPRRDNDQALLATARAFATDAAPLSATFIKHEMAADFLTTLSNHITEFENALNRRNTARGAHVSATAGMGDAMERGMDTAQRLDAVIRNKYAADPAALAAWETARRIERVTARAAAAGNGRGEADGSDKG